MTPAPATRVGLGLLLALVLAGFAPFHDHDLSVQAEVTYRFGQQVRIAATVNDARPIQRVDLFVHPEGLPRSYSHPMSQEAGRWVYVFSPYDWFLPPFARVYYWFRVTFANGETATSPSFAFVYRDDRFSWQHLEMAPVRVYWAKGDAATAQTVLNAAVQALRRTQNQWLAPTPAQVVIYLYPDPESFRSLFPGTAEWAEAHAFQTRVFLLQTADPDLLARYTAHETAHAVLYAAVGDAVARLPWWLVEGLASLAEPDLRPSYDQALRRAALENRLLPLESLCAPPPTNDPETARLAYAQAASFTAYLYRTHGPAGLQALMRAYLNGATCTAGLKQAFHMDPHTLYRDWQTNEVAYQQPILARRLPPVLLWAAAFGLMGASVALVLVWIWKQAHG